MKDHTAQNHNNMNVEKLQGVFYNTEFRRWEYYGQDSVIRAGEPQPGFVSASYQKCVDYQNKVEELK